VAGRRGADSVWRVPIATNVPQRREDARSSTELSETSTLVPTIQELCGNDIPSRSVMPAQEG
jgi:hypothetical protein